MSEKDLNSYRFLSGEDPTDEMLECIMWDALESAMNRRREAEARIKAEVDRLYVYDNSIDGQMARPLFRLSNGVLGKLYVESVPEWAQHILPTSASRPQS